MTYNFDTIIDRRGTGSFKWDFGDKLKEWGITDHFNEDTLPLFTADMDIACPPPVVEAMHRTADQLIYGYSIPPAEYYDAIRGWFRRRHGWEFSEEEIVYSPGTVYAVEAAIRCLTAPGDGVIIQRPVYTPFTRAIEEAGRKVSNNRMVPDETGHYEPDMPGFEEMAKKEENTLFILCNPHNPTGRIYSDEQLLEMSRICRENNVLIIADEIHGDLIRRDKTFTPLAKLEPDNGHIITCTAVNKTFNIAGIHATALVISDPEIREKIRKELRVDMVSPFSFNAVIAAYNECEDWLEQLKGYLDGTIDWVLEFLGANMPKAKVLRPEGTYILWMDFRGYGISAEEIRKKIYVDANVVLERGELFDPDEGAGFERICLASPRPMIEEAFRRIAREFEGL